MGQRTPITAPQTRPLVKPEKKAKSNALQIEMDLQGNFMGKPGLTVRFFVIPVLQTRPKCAIL